MERPTLKLEIFEGPLDLLLSLVQKNKMDIHDIQINIICEQYLQYLKAAEELEMTLVSDFILMASELMLIKSRMLLPREEEKKDPREELATALLIYQQAKEASKTLLPYYAEFHGRWVKDEDEIRPDNSLPTGLDPEKLMKAFTMLITRAAAGEGAETTHIKPLIRKKVVSVGERINRTVSVLKKKKSASIFEVLADSRTRGEIIASFLGLLELLKLKAVTITYSDPTDEESGIIGYDILLSINEDFDFASIKNEYDGQEEEKAEISENE